MFLRKLNFWKWPVEKENCLMTSPRGRMRSPSHLSSWRPSGEGKVFRKRHRASLFRLFDQTQVLMYLDRGLQGEAPPLPVSHAGIWLAETVWDGVKGDKEEKSFFNTNYSNSSLSMFKPAGKLQSLTSCCFYLHAPVPLTFISPLSLLTVHSV